MIYIPLLARVKVCPNQTGKHILVQKWVGWYQICYIPVKWLIIRWSYDKITSLLSRTNYCLFKNLYVSVSFPIQWNDLGGLLLVSVVPQAINLANSSFSVVQPGRREIALHCFVIFPFVTFDGRAFSNGFRSFFLNICLLYMVTYCTQWLAKLSPEYKAEHKVFLPKFENTFTNRWIIAWLAVTKKLFFLYLSFNGWQWLSKGNESIYNHA